MTYVSRYAMAVENVSLTYGPEFTARDISFAVEPGKVLAILGPNGSGKTTLFSIITGNILPMRGHVFVNGINLYRHLHQCAAQMIAVPFRPPLVTLRTPYLYWQAVGLRYGLGFRKIACRIAELAPQMDLSPHIHKSYNQLSLGMQQKAALVAAFLPDVPLRIMDEPFSGGIDPLAMEVLANWIGNARDRGESVIFSTQMLEHAERLADKILLLKNGRVVAFGSVGEIVDQTGIRDDDERPFAQAYIEATEGNPHE